MTLQVFGNVAKTAYFLCTKIYIQQPTCKSFNYDVIFNEKIVQTFRFCVGLSILMPNFKPEIFHFS